MIYLVPIVRSWGCPVNQFNAMDINGWKDPNGNQKFPTNITVAFHNNELVFNTRLTDYMYVPLGRPDRLIYIGNREEPGSVSCNAICDSEGRHQVYENNGNASTRLSNGISYKGLEDVRLVVWDGILYGIGFRPDVIPGKVIPQFIQYNDDYTIARSWFINTNKYMEKNWQPIYDMPFTFVYDPAGPRMLHLDINMLKESTDPDNPTAIEDIDTPDFTCRICGSTQVITLPDETHISICHTSHKYQGFDKQMHWTYNHYFVQYDKDMQNPRVSAPFHFIDDCMEFTCGMCVSGDKVVISFTEYDGSPQAMAIPISVFTGLVDTLMNRADELQSEPDVDYLTGQCNEWFVQGRAKLPYIMGMECHGVHAPIEHILNALNDLQVPTMYKKRILAYLIVRRPDNKELIKYYDTL